MSRELLRVTNQIEVYTIYLQPGEVIQDYNLYVADLLTTGEMVSSASVDDDVTIPSVVCEGRAIKVDIIGPGNGIQMPVKLTVMGSLGSLRHVALNIVGNDPFTTLVPSVPDLYLRWRKGWTAEGVYAPCDLVLFGGVIYLALKGSTDKNPSTNPTIWMAWASQGGGEGGGNPNLFVDAGGSGRTAAFVMTWVGPGDDDWQVEVKGVV